MFSLEDLSGQCFELSEKSFEYGSPWTVAQFLDDMNQSTHLYYFKHDGDVLQGVLCVSYVLDEAEIVLIAVANESKHQGVGKILLNECLDELKQKGICHVFLEVRSSNQMAIEFYKNNRFCTVGQRKRYYQHPVEDAMIMELNI